MDLSYKTTDGFQAVHDWYQGQLGEPGEITKLPNGHNKAIWNIRKNGWDITIIVTCIDQSANIDIHKEQI